MAVTSTTYRASLLIEYAEDGSILSRVQTNKTLVRDGDALIAPPKLEAVALDEAALAAVIGDSAAAVSAQVTALQADKATLTTEKATALADLATMTAARDAAVAEKETAATAHAAALATAATDKETALAALQSQLDTATATIAARNATIHDLQNPPAPTDPVVTALQARIAMKQAGVLGAVLAHMAALPEDDTVRIYWEYATQFHRSNPVLTGVASALGLTDQQVDDLFAAAQQVQ